MSEDKDRLNRYVSDRLNAGAKLQRKIVDSHPGLALGALGRGAAEMSDECYACMVGVSTGPESHSEGCPLRAGLRPRDSVTVHRVWTQYEDDRGHWECSCGRGGSAAEHMVDLHSDRHIVDAGGRRIDVSSEEGLYR